MDPPQEGGRACDLRPPCGRCNHSLQMAFTSALDEDGRTCPANVDVVKFLAEAMRSIADGEVDKAKRRVPPWCPKLGVSRTVKKRKSSFPMHPASRFRH